MRQTWRRAAVVAVAAVGMGLGSAVLVPGTAAATEYTCSDGTLYEDGAAVEGNVRELGSITISCRGDRVRTVYHLD